MTALVVGKPLVGMRALDISRAVDLLQAREDVDPNHILALGRGNGAVSVLYAAMLDERLKKIVLERMLASYQAIVGQKIHRQDERPHHVSTICPILSPRLPHARSGL
jgi:predicted esterase